MKFFLSFIKFQIPVWISWIAGSGVSTCPVATIFIEHPIRAKAFTTPDVAVAETISGSWMTVNESAYEGRTN